jgi:hypothetical protein
MSAVDLSFSHHPRRVFWYRPALDRGVPPRRRERRGFRHGPDVSYTWPEFRARFAGGLSRLSPFR